MLPLLQKNIPKRLKINQILVRGKKLKISSKYQMMRMKRWPDVLPRLYLIRMEVSRDKSQSQLTMILSLIQSSYQLIHQFEKRKLKQVGQIPRIYMNHHLRFPPKTLTKNYLQCRVRQMIRKRIISIVNQTKKAKTQSKNQAKLIQGSIKFRSQINR